ncbi:TetR family transcriptional regulator C-terminal domain-containing protein [Nocardiopsis sp. HNM0947]|uniref:TetR family transcriptional regulator C-terminal domain-containing protein n=1 Tax=Nocardiopsis coralli TaxID=2772213 RepID=A0ABR9PCL5_9ACTN|nr:TetR family transcriptional regulator C-terminal domain-containing protein [Nocardiopsis coralli]MBE3001554.1 TetR family transcriptional regulator C-terminal domain-containing protein [Nocardiopsis coralli]
MDPVQRRRAIVAAVFRLVEAGGVGAVSLREVAREAGLNIGSVRHYFSSHRALMSAAAQEVGERMAARLEGHTPGEGDPVERVAFVAEELLPLDAERTTELTVLSEFVSAARTEELYRPMARTMAADMRTVLREALAGAGAERPHEAAEDLAALVAGLGHDAVLPHGSPGPDGIRASVRRFLRGVLPGGSPD